MEPKIEKKHFAKLGLTPESIIKAIEEYNSNHNQKIAVPSESVINRWGKKVSPAAGRDPVTKYPSFEILLLLAKKTGTNISYLLGLTDVSDPLSYEILGNNFINLCSEQILSKAAFAEKTGFSPTTIRKLEEQGFALAKMATVVKICETLNCSIDYLFALTDRQNWSKNSVFSRLLGGEALRIEKENHVVYGLFSFDTKNVIFADASVRSIYDSFFDGAKIEILK